nr:MAG TPA: hypothetical protein [Caudoviricetes sp.]
MRRGGVILRSAIRVLRSLAQKAPSQISYN